MPSDPPVRRPRIARPPARSVGAPLAITLLVFGSGVFAKMVDSRSDRVAAAQTLPPLAINTIAAPVPLTTGKPVAVAALMTRQTPVMLSAAPPGSGYVPALARPFAPAPTTRPPPSERFAGAALLFDLFSGRASSAQSPRLAQDQAALDQVPGAGSENRPDPTGDAIAAANAVRPSPSTGTGNERFSERVGSKQTEATEARQLPNLHRLVPQGAILGAVMETALNSDLPGYARAVVTKDVLSFDGSSVLIPAGSRVVGEYNSGVAQGASRVFIVWSRLIRPDGVAITLGSPAVDELGRGGLGGKVNRHFIQRFGGAILLSVLTGGISAVAGAIGRGSTVVVNSTSEATSLLSQAARGGDIPPTIKTDQGALVRIFVARDLDFTVVGPARS